MNLVATFHRLVLPLLLVACAASGASPRFVVLESDSYGCGAAEGLGCGLAIAPVLASIDDLDGVAESSVSWDGRYFRVEVLPGADAEAVAAEAAALLEGDACCATSSQGNASAAPDEWYDAEGTRALSRHEAGVIASTFTSAVTAEVTLEPASAERLHTLLRDELERAFEGAHSAGGGVSRLWEQLPQARTNLEGRLDFLSPEQKARVVEVIDQQLEEE